jgi:hypothetical protein
MSATTGAELLEPSAAWLAAYALGLAYSEGSDQRCVTGLIDATGDHPELLEAAHRRLDGAEVAEQAVREAALHLLDRARGSIRRDRPHGHGSVRPGDRAADRQLRGRHSVAIDDQP